MLKIEAKVAAVVSDTHLVLNKGKRDGVTIRSRVVLMTEHTVKDPDSGEVLGHVTVPKARLQVVELQDSLTVARTELDSVDGTTLAFFGSRPKLHLGTAPRPFSNSDITLQVGDVAIIEVVDSVGSDD
ncbi:hypothetical protein [Amycolatopsis sp. cmx-4-68]|uniref:hypothetical protein n=1 Tax=Amycolatopsis sp. cmx-4-68 TaxID=2790938 RepID=UPI00397AD2D8